MKTKTINLYSYSELSKEAKEKAHQDWIANNTYTFLQDDLREYIHEELTDKGYTHTELTPLYDLSYCQGSGLMFEGTVTDKDGNTYTIKHSGRYYHERSTDITGVDKEGEEIDTKDFEENVYIPICQQVKQRGYEQIEYEDSLESFVTACEDNDYTFEESGKMNNI